MNKEAKFPQPPYSNDIDEIAIGEPITIFVGEGSAPIATVNNFDDFPCADEDQMEEIDAQAQATARLFCASPDLLEACEVALNISHWCANERARQSVGQTAEALKWTVKINEAEEKLRAAINKALGNAKQEVKGNV